MIAGGDAGAMAVVRGSGTNATSVLRNCEASVALAARGADVWAAAATEWDAGLALVFASVLKASANQQRPEPPDLFPRTM